MTPKATKNAPAKPPKQLEKAGRTLWQSVISEFELEEHHRRLLLAACQQADTSAAAQEELAKSGLTVNDRFGQVRPHPLVEVARQAQLAMAKLLRELNLDCPPPESRPPQRPGVRL